MAQEAIWPGSGSAASGSTPFAAEPLPGHNAS